MSRKIVDSIVEKRNEELKVFTPDSDFYFMYGGTVQVGFPKMKIKQLEQKPTPHVLLYDVMRYYNGIQFSDEPAIIIAGDQQINTFPEVVKCLKALLLGQLNKNDEFSIAVAEGVSQLFRMLLQSEAILPLAPRPDFTKFQTVVLDEVSNFIMSCFEKEGIGWTDRAEVQQLTAQAEDIVSEVYADVDDEEDDDLDF